MSGADELEIAERLLESQKRFYDLRAPDYGDETDYLRVFINHLRKKIEPDPSRPNYVVTEPWVGYRFVIPDSS